MTADIIVKQAKIINKDANILPHHQLCLNLAFVPSDSADPTSLLIFITNDVATVTNALDDHYQFLIHRDVLAPYHPQTLTHIHMWTFIDPLTAESLDSITGCQ